jgi:hypothetical protein
MAQMACGWAEGTRDGKPSRGPAKSHGENPARRRTACDCPRTGLTVNRFP